jgi:PAS domain S-box-containing protein
LVLPDIQIVLRGIFGMGKQDLLPLRKEISPSKNKEKTRPLGLILLFIILSLSVIAGSALYYRQYEINFRARAEEQLSAIAELKVNELVEWRKERLADAALFYRNGDFAALVKRYFDNPNDVNARDRLQTWLGKLAENDQYDRVFLLDAKGNERLSKPGDHEPAAANLVKNEADVLQSGKIAFLDFHRDSPDGPIRLALLVPIFDNNRPLSVLVLRIDPNTYLYPYIQKWPVPSKTSETLIARREGNAAVFLNELKFQKNTALKLQIPLEKAATPVVEAVLGNQGIMKGIDYRGMRVLAVTRTVPDSPWFLVARTDIVEVFAPLRARLLQMVLFIFIILAAMGGCLFLLLRQQRMRFYREQIKAAEALRISEELYHSLFENMLNGFAFCKMLFEQDLPRDFIYLDVNAAFEKLTGLTNVVGKKASDAIPGIRESDPELIKRYGRVAKTGVPEVFETFVKALDMWFFISVYCPKKDHFVAVFDVITERKRVMEALQASEEKFRNEFDNSAIGKSFTSLDGSVEVNPAFCEMLGYTKEELAHQNWHHLTHPDDNELTQKKLNELLSGEKSSARFRKRYLKKDGAIVWADVNTVLQKDKDGKPLYYITAVVDITDRKRAEEALLKSEGRLNFALQIIRTGAWELDLRDHTAHRTLLHDQIFGYKTVLPSWTYEMFLEHVVPEDRPEVDRSFGEATASQTNWDFECRICRIDGERRWIRAAGVHERNSEGNPVRMSGIVQDITERKLLEDKLHQYTMQLEQKSRDLEQIIYVASHDLRSPLVNVQGFAKELSRSIMALMEAINTGDISAEAMRRMEPILKKDIPESLEYIQSSIARMDRQLSALLKLSRLGRAAITIENLDMDGLVDEIVKSLEYMAKEKGAQITVAKLPPCMADAAQTNQIFLNLIGNALKYLDAQRPGIIQVRGNTRENRVIYCVEDNGVGIPPECQDKIFEIFYRVEQNKCAGEGLGLTIVRQSAEKQSGAVWVESELGKGSRFFVKLPGI